MIAADMERRASLKKGEQICRLKHYVETLNNFS